MTAATSYTRVATDYSRRLPGERRLWGVGAIVAGAIVLAFRLCFSPLPLPSEKAYALVIVTCDCVRHPGGESMAPPGELYYCEVMLWKGSAWKIWVPSVDHAIREFHMAGYGDCRDVTGLEGELQWRDQQSGKPASNEL